MFYATDAVSLGDVRVSDGGYLEAFARTVRTGCQTYLGAEVGKPEMQVVTVYRDENEVFSKDSLESFRLIPVTIDHPPAGVTAKNWRNVARGTTGAEVLRDGEYLRLGLRVKDEAAVTEVRSGKCQLSAGYRCELQWGDGVAPDGTHYQAKQVGIVADHIAIVSAGRAGPQCRIGDSWPATQDGGPRDPDISNDQRTQPHKEMVSMKTLTIDGHSVALDDAAFIAVTTLQKQLGTAVADALAKDTALTTALKDHTKALSDKDGEILKLQADHKVAVDTKDAEITKLKAEAITADKLDAAVAERTAVVDAAKPILGVTFDAKGKTVNDIRRAAVAKRLGDKAVEGRADDHVAIAFDTLTAAGVVADPLGRALADSIPNNVNDQQSSDPHVRRKAALQDAWKQAPAA